MRGAARQGRVIIAHDEDAEPVHEARETPLGAQMIGKAEAVEIGAKGARHPAHQINAAKGQVRERQIAPRPCP